MEKGARVYYYYIITKVRTVVEWLGPIFSVECFLLLVFYYDGIYSYDVKCMS